MSFFSSLILPLLIVAIIVYGLLKKVPVYEEFVIGAKEGFATAVQIIPNLVAILFAIGMFRASGAMEFIATLLAPLFELTGFPSELLPMAIFRPLTGSGSVAILAELIQTHGEESLIVKMAAIMFGSTETTFYVIAVYFGAIGVHKIRYAVQAGLIADFAGMAAAVTVGYWFFG
ncbi:MAG: nucleoside recognition domain-containing protein [Gammaproteobacteria bacterium]|nr:nucleoside recognition domain-containing protein [Gammaproteobacteria bacterium]